MLGTPVKTVDDAKLAAKKLHDMGCRDVIVTLGEMGCVVIEGSTSNVTHLPAPKVEALDTTVYNIFSVSTGAFVLLSSYTPTNNV